MHWLSQLFAKPASRSRSHVRSFRPALEALEDRQLLATAPVLLAPSGWAAPVTVFTWAPQTNAAYYNFQIYNLNTKNNIAGPGLTQTSLALGSPLIVGDTYQWSVQVVDTLGTVSPWSTLTISVTNLTPPTLLGPSGPAEPQPVFTWSPLAGAVHYDIWVQNQITGQVIRNTNVSGTNWTPPTPLTQGSTYSWWVRGVDANAISGPWSAAVTFSESVLPAPTLSAPSGSAGLQPTLTWNAVVGADHYDIWLQDETSGQLIRDTTVPATSWVPPAPLTAHDNYTWWVRAIDPATYDGQWSTPLSFTAYAVAAPTLVGPSGSASTFANFRWNAVDGADHYDIWVQDMQTGQVQRDQQVLGTNWIAPNALKTGDTEQWWVRALNAADSAGPWSSSLTFTAFALPAPTLVAPTGSSTAVPTFSWSAVEGAAHYDIFVQDMQTGQVVRDQIVPGTTWTPITPLTQGHPYNWWVRALDNSGLASAWSASASFSVAALTAPVLASPTGSSAPLPTFSWNAVAGADHYDVWVQDTKTGQVLRDMTVAATTWVLSEPAQGWRQFQLVGPSRGQRQ